MPATEAEVLAGVTAVLADTLQIDPDVIHPEQTFRELGFDSMLTVAFVAGLNARYGTQVNPAAPLDHRTPAALARHLVGRRITPSTVTSETPGEPGEPGAGVVADRALVVLEVLRGHLAGLLHRVPEDIDAEQPFQEVGLDSILAAEFIAGVNHTYGLAEQPTALHDHPSLAALAAHVVSRTSPTSPAPTAPLDLQALLHAVRDDALSIDEAVALLAARA
ncbi:acyl carrier protein [Streptomyces canus]|uniref:acyl carrier protein n=1 Tax=Streptomyces canus TaxID=58343 RepID=UPI002E36EBC8|nr:acyl carrier protein [Streptomyces canus]